MADAEQSWVVRRFAGRPVLLPGGPRPPCRTTWAGRSAAYRATWPVVEAIIAEAPGPDARCADDPAEPPVTLRWVVAHLLEETARHAGHADIIRELIDGGTGR